MQRAAFKTSILLIYAHTTSELGKKRPKLLSFSRDACFGVVVLCVVPQGIIKSKDISPVSSEPSTRVEGSVWIKWWVKVNNRILEERMRE